MREALLPVSNEMNAAVLLTKSLEEGGVKYVFGLPGEENLALLEALRHSTIRYVTVRDEQTAVFMAATVGRLTGRVGVALSTLGPGATNLVTGVAYAQLGGMPTLVITGQKPIKKSKQGRFQIIDVVRMMKPITKFSETIQSADRIPSIVYDAIRIAEIERPGATHLELPEDIADEESDGQPIAWQKIRRPVPDEKIIGIASKVIESAKLPVIVAANAANRKLVRKQLKNFIEKTCIPFATTQMGKGALDEGMPQYLGTTALSSDDYVNRALATADLVIMVGHDISEKPPILANADQKILHINFYPAEIDAVYTPDLEVIGDISNALWAMGERISPPSWNFEPLFAYKRMLEDEIAQEGKNADFPMRPARFVADLRSVMPRDGIIALDNGMYKIWVARNYKAYEQNTVLLDNAFASMGAGLGSGIAVKLLHPDKKVVVVAGDGGFLMNIGDLETAQRLKLDLVIVIVNDGGYGMIRWKQESLGMPEFGLAFGNPDFVKLAESFGARGTRIQKAEEFAPTLARVLSEGGVHIIDLPVNYADNAALSSSALRAKMARP